MNRYLKRRMTRLVGILMLGLVFTLSSAGAEEYPVLNESGYEGHTGAIVDYPMLTGSGYERYAVVHTSDRDTANTPTTISATSVLDGSGYQVSTTAVVKDSDTTSTVAKDSSDLADTFYAVLGGSGYELDVAVAAAAE